MTDMLERAKRIIENAQIAEEARERGSIVQIAVDHEKVDLARALVAETEVTTGFEILFGKSVVEAWRERARQVARTKVVDTANTEGNPDRRHRG